MRLRSWQQPQPFCPHTVLALEVGARSLLSSKMPLLPRKRSPPTNKGLVCGWPFCGKNPSSGRRHCGACGHSATVRSPAGFSLPSTAKPCRPAARTCPARPHRGCLRRPGRCCGSVLACDHHLAGLRARVGAPCSQQLDALAPLFFSLHDLGEYEACQAELPALLAFDPGPRPRTSCSLAVVRRPRDQVVDSGACVYDPVLPDPLRVSARSCGHSTLPLAAGCWLTLMLSTVSVVARGSVFW